MRDDTKTEATMEPSAAAAPEPRLLRLPTGLGLVVQQVPNAPAVAIHVWVGVGGADERDGERGLAHLHEHMLFKGTSRRGVGQVAAEVEGVGGQINAWTSLDQTVYHVTMPAHEWRTGLDVLADVICDSSFDPGELSREIEVVCEEIRRAEDSPGRVIYRGLLEAVFGDHPYAKPVLGTAESVRAMDRDRMRAFFGRHYRASNTIVSIAGPMAEAEVRTAVADAFAKQRRDAAVKRPAPVQPSRPSSARVMRSAFSETRLAVGFRAPDLLGADVAALDVFALILGQGESSRLFRRVRRDLGLVNDIGASCWTPQRGGVFSISFSTSDERVMPALSATLSEVRALLDTGPDEEEVERARRQIVSEATWKLETVQGQAHSNGFYAQALGDPTFERRYHDAINAVTVADVRRVGNVWLRGDQAHAVLLVGTAQAEQSAAAAAGQSDAPAPAAPPATGEAAVASTAPLPDEAALLQALAALGVPAATPQRGEVRGRAVSADGVIRIELATGDRLLVLPDRSVPVFALRHAVSGGQRDEEASTAGRALLAAELVTRGTSRRSADEISFAMDGMAGEIAAIAGRNSFGLSVATLARHGEAMLDLTLQCMLDATLPDAELEVARRAQLEAIRHQRDSPARQAFRAAMAVLCGDHPYGLDMIGHDASVAALTRQDLLTYVQGRFAPGQAVWAACGDVDPDWLTQRLNAALVGRSGGAPPPTVRPVAALAATERLRLHSAKVQSHVVLAYQGAKLTAPERFALQVLAALLGGQGGRLFLDLRDRQSLAYSVSASSSEGTELGAFTFYIGTAPDKVATALAGLTRHIDRVCEERVGADELDRARRSLAGGYAIGLQRSGARASALCLAELYGTGAGGWQAEIDALLAVTSEDVLGAAQRFLGRGHHVEVVVGPEAT